MGDLLPCASCKLRRRRCTPDCIFAPYFPSDDPQKFTVVHKTFGTSNVSIFLQELPVHQRGDAVISLVYEANARVRDPVNGCVGKIASLQNQVSELRKKLVVSQAQIPCLQNHEAVKDGKSKEAFETAQEKEPSGFAAAEKFIMNFPFDLNELPSDEDEDIMP